MLNLYSAVICLPLEQQRNGCKVMWGWSENGNGARKRYIVRLLLGKSLIIFQISIILDTYSLGNSTLTK